MIKVSNLNKFFGDFQALKNINLEINKGEIVAIVGASGAGKTTLLQILGTLEKAESNSNLQVNNQNILSLSDKELSKFRNQNLGFVFQFHQLLPEFTALENVCIPGLISKRNKKEVEKEAIEILDYLGLKDKLNSKPNELSGGQQQRVAVARALINKPLVVFADEPSGNLDHTSAENLHQLFFDLRTQFNQTFIIVTHNEELANMADRKLVMVDGEIV